MRLTVKDEEVKELTEKLELMEKKIVELTDLLIVLPNRSNSTKYISIGL